MDWPKLNFVTYAELVADVRAWSVKLPQNIVAVAGIPRSGTLVASLLALHRNIPLITLDDIIAGREPWLVPMRRRPEKPKRVGSVLLADDSCSTGQTFHNTLQRLPIPLPYRIEFGAVYGPDPSQEQFPQIHTHRPILQPRVFEWNVFHSAWAQAAVWDIDGVLCDDPTEQEADDGPGLDRFLLHLRHAPPKHIPSTPILGICTGRLEKYREQTEAWLARHGVRYSCLQMSPHKTAAARREAGDTAYIKARAYHAIPGAQLFIESGPAQAAAIVKMARRPVLCVDRMEMLNHPSGGQVVGHALEHGGDEHAPLRDRGTADSP